MKKRLLFLILSVSLVLNAIAATVFAMTDGEEIINAILHKNIQMTWNGDEFAPVDPVSNERVYPIVYNDRTYIPARFIAEKAGIAVGWDEGTNTVSFDTRQEAPSDVPTENTSAEAAATAPADTVTTVPEVPKAIPVPIQTESKIAPFKGTVQQFEGKIAIITGSIDVFEEEYYSAQMAVSKYGADKVIHKTSLFNMDGELEEMGSIMTMIAADPEIKAVIINMAVPGTNAGMEILRRTRKDIFVVCCTSQENPADVAERANLVLMPDELGMGYTMPLQAAKMGAKMFVHYSFPRHMSYALLSGRREILKEECARLGIQFVDATAPDPTSDAGILGAQRFILEDVPKRITENGKDIAFFATNCSMQLPLIKSVADGGAIYPQPCCPSPLHGFSALGIEGGVLEMDWVIAETSRILGENGVSGRFSTWPVPASLTQTYAGVEYAIKWINGEVPKEGLDFGVLKECMEEYAGVDVTLTWHEDHGIRYDNYVYFLMDYLNY